MRHIPVCPPNPVSLFWPHPSKVSHAQAAPLTVGGLEAVHFLRQANVQSGESVLIVGAGGSIGTYALQLAIYLGARVIAVDSTEKLELLRSLGAANVLDYTQTDFTARSETYDVIVDAVGKNSLSRTVNCLNPNGRYLAVNPSFAVTLRGSRTLQDGKRVIVRKTGSRNEDVLYLTQLVQAGTLKTVIDRTYPLDQLAEAHRYVEAGHKKGNVVITVEGNAS